MRRWNVLGLGVIETLGSSKTLSCFLLSHLRLQRRQYSTVAGQRTRTIFMSIPGLRPRMMGCGPRLVATGSSKMKVLLQVTRLHDYSQCICTPIHQYRSSSHRWSTWFYSLSRDDPRLGNSSRRFRNLQRCTGICCVHYSSGHILCICLWLRN